MAESNKTNLAKQLYLQACQPNSLPEDNPESTHNLLGKAIKLDPTLIDAWNMLAEYYWNKRELVSAKNCLMGALSQKNGQNKVSLRNLSMVLRQLETSDATEKRNNVEESVQRAKDAVALDVNDGTSWYILGNAHLGRFFMKGEQQDPQDLNKAHKAYHQAILHGDAKNPDLHYNRAVLYKYQEEYGLACEGFGKAMELDPSWAEPATALKQTLELVDRVAGLLHTNANLKTKQFSQAVGAAGRSRPPDSALAGRTDGTLRGLGLGLAHGTAVTTKVIALASDPGVVPMTLVVVDKEGTVMAASIYNIATTSITLKQSIIEYKSLQTESTAILLDGLPVAPTHRAPSTSTSTSPATPPSTTTTTTATK